MYHSYRLHREDSYSPSPHPATISIVSHPNLLYVAKCGAKKTEEEEEEM